MFIGSLSLSSLGWNRCAHCFVSTAAAVLVLTGLAKVVSGIGTAHILAMQDPIVGMPFGKLLPLVGSVELVLGLACLFKRVPPRVQLGLIAWLATGFLLYRLRLWCVGWHHPCGCMGSLAGAVHLTDNAADQVMKAVLAYLLVGSYALLLANWRRPLAVTQ